MSKQAHRYITDPVAIPEQGEGNGYRVRHIRKPAGWECSTANARCEVLGGQKPQQLQFGVATQWHSLEYEGGVWMTDYPCEQAQADQCIESMRGRVLVGGLGLGYAANRLLHMGVVESVLVVERQHEVIDMVQPHIKDPGGRLTVVQADLFSYLRGEPLPFDTAFLDIWQSDRERTFFDTVVPLRALCHRRGVADCDVVCWNESVMRGQLLIGLQGKYMSTKWEGTNQPMGFELGLKDYVNPPAHARADWMLGWSVPFFQAVRDGLVDDSNFGPAAALYAGMYGMREWRARWMMELRARGLLKRHCGGLEEHDGREAATDGAPADAGPGHDTGVAG